MMLITTTPFITLIVMIMPIIQSNDNINANVGDFSSILVIIT